MPSTLTHERGRSLDGAETFKEDDARRSDLRADDARENDVRANEARENEARENDANDSRVNDSRVKESRANDSRANESRENESRANDSRANKSSVGGSRGVVARMWSREDAAWLAGWTAFAFALRVLLLVGVEHVVSPDSVMYAGLARQLAAGNFAEGLSAYWPPLYPALVSVASFVFDDIEMAGRFVSVVAGSLLTLAAYRLARQSYGRDAARLSVVLVALHPLLVYYSTVMLTEAVYTLLFTCGVAAGWTAVAKTSARRFLTAGALFGACYLLKPEAAGYVLLLAAVALGARAFGERKASLKTSLSGAAAACAGFLVVALPYLIYLRRETGAWTLSAKLAGHLWQGSRRAGEVVPHAPGLFPDATTAVVQLTKALRYEYELLNLVFPLAFVVAASLGLFATRWTRARAGREAYLLLFFAATLAGYAVTLPNIRFLVPLAPLVICWTARGVIEFERWANGTARRLGVAEKFRRRGARVLRPAVVALLLVSLAPLFVYLLRGDKWGDYYGQKRAALWIREREGAAGAPPVIMSTAPVAAFYARGRHVALADEELAKMLARARRERADYVIINERSVKHMRLKGLLDAAETPPELRLVHGLAESPEHRVLVYTLASP